MSYITALSRLCNYKRYSQLIDNRLQVLRLFEELKDIQEIKKYSDVLKKLLTNFENEKFIYELFDIFNSEDLVPLYEPDVFENFEDVFMTFPYMLVGYWGQYDQYIHIDDIENMSEVEKVMAMLFMSCCFCIEKDGYDRIKYEGFLDAMKNKKVANKIRVFLNNGTDLSQVYRGFCEDYKNEQYKKDDFTENFLYLFQRIVKDTGCSLIDCTPEEADQGVVTWADAPGFVYMWKEYKQQEKKHNEFIKDLNSNKKLRKRFYDFLFNEVIPRYKD